MTHKPAASPSASTLSSAQPRSERNSNQVTCRLARKAGFLYAAAFLLFGHVARPAQAQTLAPTWTQLSPANSPQERYIHAMTYDAGHSQVVLFGGFGQVFPFYLNDTWLWNGSNWTQANPSTSPNPRAAHALVYDAAHGNVVLFGGTSSSTNRFGDTWLWDGTNWTQANPVASPSARDGAVMVYDATNHNVVLFGGSTGSGSANDTWTWDGTNWTQLSASSSPTARADYSMVYDAAHGQVVLFGGSDSSGFRNDTWIWNGTNWTQRIPGSSPPARDTQGMAYDSALGEVLMWGGRGSSGFLNDTWAWDGTNWTQLNSTTTPPVGRYAPNAVIYDSAQNQFLLFSGQNSSQVFDDTWTFGPPQNFGNVNVCPSGQNSPAPCSNTLALTYNFSITATLGSIQVVTQGVGGLDFSQANGGNCSGTILQGHSCAIDITFAPIDPGLRTGAVTFYDSDNTPIATTPIYGIGQAPLVAFGLLPSQPVNFGTFSLNGPKGVVVDPAGTIYIADTGNGRVLQSGVGGIQTFGFGFSSPQGLALDGAGDLFVADPGSGPSGEVIEIPAGCTSAACQVVVYNPAPHPSPVAVAVDGTGNLYVADDPDGIVKIPRGCLATVSSSCQTTVGTGFSHPTGIAVDAAGNLFVSDSGLQQVVEIPAGCAQQRVPDRHRHWMAGTCKRLSECCWRPLRCGCGESRGGSGWL